MIIRQTKSDKLCDEWKRTIRKFDDMMDPGSIVSLVGSSATFDRGSIMISIFAMFNILLMAYVLVRANYCLHAIREFRRVLAGKLEKLFNLGSAPSSEAEQDHTQYQ